MKRRYIQFGIGGAIIAAILIAVLYQGVQSTVFFQTPAEILAAPEKFRNRTIRIGALVQPLSTSWDPIAVQLKFRVTEDSKAFIPVIFNGVKPDMYREGQGVVVEGQLDDAGIFRATQVLVKHSEDYSVDKEKVRDKEQIYKSLMNSGTSGKR